MRCMQPPELGGTWQPITAPDAGAPPIPIGVGRRATWPVNFETANAIDSGKSSGPDARAARGLLSKELFPQGPGGDLDPSRMLFPTDSRLAGNPG